MSRHCKINCIFFPKAIYPFTNLYIIKAAVMLPAELPAKSCSIAPLLHFPFTLVSARKYA